MVAKVYEKVKKAQNEKTHNMSQIQLGGRKQRSTMDNSLIMIQLPNEEDTKNFIHTH